jgi:hypothetical protein
VGPSSFDGYVALSLDQNQRWIRVNPSAHHFSLPCSLLSRAAPQCIKRRSTLRRRRTTVTPRAPSSALTPTDGWTRRRQEAPQRGPTSANPQESRSGGMVQPSTTRWPELDIFSHTAPRLAVATMVSLERAAVSCASRSTHAACGSTTTGGDGHGICAQR